MFLCAGQPQSAAAFLAYIKQVISDSALYCVLSVELNISEGFTFISCCIPYRYCDYILLSVLFYRCSPCVVFYSVQ